MKYSCIINLFILFCELLKRNEYQALHVEDIILRNDRFGDKFVPLKNLKIFEIFYFYEENNDILASGVKYTANKSWFVKPVTAERIGCFTINLTPKKEAHESILISEMKSKLYPIPLYTDEMKLILYELLHYE